MPSSDGTREFWEGLTEATRAMTRHRRGLGTYRQLEDDQDGVVIQRDDMRERLDRIRAAAESDPDIPSAVRDFLLRETRPGWLHITPEMVERLRTTGTHHA